MFWRVEGDVFVCVMTNSRGADRPFDRGKRMLGLLEAI
jgi:hypothetical protein